LKTTGIAIYLLAAVSSLGAGTIEPTLILSNFQHDATVSINDYGAFYGFEFSTVIWRQGLQGEPVALLSIDGGGRLGSNPVAQFIHATASVDFSTPGYLVKSIFLWGWANDDGPLAGENYRITFPCAAAVDGSNGFRNCTVPNGGVGSGTIFAFLDMRSDAAVGLQDSGSVGGMRVAMTLEPVPEPSEATVLALLLLFAAFWRIIRLKYSQGYHDPR
jgi:hypothetical protein